MVEKTINSIFNIPTFEKMDVYLLDQIFKGRLTKDLIVLDAGCGQGRNSIPLLQNGFQISCIDPKEQELGNFQEQFTKSSIEDYQSDLLFDFIICNAVLHFSKSQIHFEEQVNKLVSLLNSNGVLFIRMTSDIGISTQSKLANELFQLKDGSTRYLISRQQIDNICTQYELKLIEPVKTTLVEDLRAMTTIVLKKK